MSNSISPYEYNFPIIRHILDLEYDIMSSYKPKKKTVHIKYNKKVYFNQNLSPFKDKREIKVEKYFEKVLPNNNHPINLNVNINNNYYTFSNLKLEHYQHIPMINNEEINPLFIGIPCMNCGNSILIDCIEKHSLTCTKVSEEISKNEKSNVALYSINYKIKKLKEHLDMINNGKILVPSTIQKEIKGTTQTLSNFVQSVFNMETIGLATIKEFKMIMKGLDELSDKYKGISAMILIDRTKVLVNEKTKIFKEQYRLLKNTKETNNQKRGSLKAEEKIKESMTIQAKNKIDIEDELEEEHDHKKIVGRLSTNILDEIESDIEKRSCVPSNTSLSSIALRKDDEEFLNDNEVNIDYFSINSDEIKEKKAFFKTVLKLKFEKLHCTHLGQKISQRALYNEVKRKNIPRDKWNDFIINELKNPNKYIQNKIARLTETMDIIEEER